ncbi:winged helix-turn-helix domain-containing protein [Actinotalea sp. M2MS4P-6]|uniref:ArsR/SmtB family transcription factor n=1 Tax=Actinotalea sp. M2MS4P-6 TaxID=2983762 RepID=UPI0021E4BCC4|nr:winged helix-turn-helix domain-containing protein [Actinotalea sp. M2MS4P-6]MCV2395428.1 winged helix-turn-helix domain-containing protein [Actinotalea sp. M2MS4P-6]
MAQDPNDEPAGAVDAHAEVDADARALASVLRMRILRLCLDEPRTNKEIAARLGRDPATTYHHVRRLAERGFLAAQPERRGARGAREVPYLATRKSWRTPMPEGGNRVLIETLLEEIGEADPATVRTARLGVRLSAEAFAELEEQIANLLTEYASREPDADGVPYSIFIAYHEDAARKPSGSDA